MRREREGPATRRLSFYQEAEKHKDTDEGEEAKIVLEQGGRERETAPASTLCNRDKKHNDPDEGKRKTRVKEKRDARSMVTKTEGNVVPTPSSSLPTRTIMPETRPKRMAYARLLMSSWSVDDSIPHPMAPASGSARPDMPAHINAFHLEGGDRGR